MTNSNQPDWAALETSLTELTPEFPVQCSERKVLKPAEIQTQAAFLTAIRMLAPDAIVFANANSGKRNPSKARAEGVRAGVFDVTIIQDSGLVAYVEFKGFDKRGRAGSLSDPQIEFGNALVRRQIPCACFFDSKPALEWLASHGFKLKGFQHG